MPLFEYKCDDCGMQFEELTSGNEQNPPCPSCQSQNTRKLMSVFAASGTADRSAPSCARPGCGSGFS